MTSRSSSRWPAALPRGRAPGTPTTPVRRPLPVFRLSRLRVSSLRRLRPISANEADAFTVRRNLARAPGPDSARIHQVQGPAGVVRCYHGDHAGAHVEHALHFVLGDPAVPRE